MVEDFVKSELGYGDKEFVVNNDVGILYDVDETENLSKKLSDLGRYTIYICTHILTVVGIQPDSFLTIIDEDDEDTFVNVVINIQES